MTPNLLKYLCEPLTKDSLKLVNEKYDAQGNIISGELVSSSGNRYPVINGIPRFVSDNGKETVESFGDEWNHFNFIDHKVNWLNHTVKNTFGSPDLFKDKIIVDAGGGSGSQSRWFSEYGASHVIMLELSHSIDGIVHENLKDCPNVDVIQCSIDSPPIRDNSIDGIVYCHNVIQHTQSVEKTAHALFDLTTGDGELVFNCYPLNDQGLFRWIRWHLIYRPMRAILSRMPFFIILLYARIMASLRMIPVLGELLEKTLLVGQGDVPVIEGEPSISRLKRRFRSASLNTFDAYGGHQYQHHKRDDEIKFLVEKLQPDPGKVKNMEKYFTRPPPIGCALRIFR